MIAGAMMRREFALQPSEVRVDDLVQGRSPRGGVWRQVVDIARYDSGITVLYLAGAGGIAHEHDRHWRLRGTEEISVLREVAE